MIIIKNLSYSSPSGERLFEDISFNFSNRKIGIVGKNGIGKTTLLRLIVGNLEPDSGAIQNKTKTAYMPQDYQIDPEKSASDVLGINKKLEAISKIKTGEQSEDFFNIIGEDWDIKDKTTEILGNLGMKNFDLDQKIKELSGGERMKVVFASLLMQNADFLIMDEPTNNLDVQTKKILCKEIEKWKKGVLVVSHDRELLNLMEEIVEISEHGLKIYGGNYEFYFEQKRIENEAIEKQFNSAKQKFYADKKEALTVEKRQQRRNSRGKKRIDKLGLDKATINAMAGQANATTGKLKIKHEQKIRDSRNKLENIKSRITEDNQIFIEIPKSQIPNGKLVAEFKDITFSYKANEPLIENLSFTISGPERIALVGPNGSGKTTLVKLLTGELKPDRGEIKIGVSHIKYIDQNMDFLDPDMTLLENIQKSSERNSKEARNWLAKFLFTEDSVFKNFCDLSGGERIRAALASIFAKKEPPQLLILDEPTNNLDIDSLERLESALMNFQGAMIIISHDQTFLNNIRIERKIELS